MNEDRYEHTLGSFAETIADAAHAALGLAAA
jgi:hypothetical protein